MDFDERRANARTVLDLTACRQPDFSNLETVLAGGRPARPCLFELFLNDGLYEELAGPQPETGCGFTDRCVWMMNAYRAAGYDYFTLNAPFSFPRREHPGARTYSLNATALITGWDSFRAFPWPDAKAADYSYLGAVGERLPAGMKAVPLAPCGVLENAVGLCGYENLCLLLYDDERLVRRVFDAVGSVLLDYYSIVAAASCVGAVIVNDDWGFKTQLMISAADMRRYVLPWQRKFVDVIHAAGKRAILHSCGCLRAVEEDIFAPGGFDAKHSYEDSIEPVERAYVRLRGKTAVLGGIDLDFVCRAGPGEVYRRAKRMLALSAPGGGYALGTGNSVPDYVPRENYYAMLLAALEV
ncbi:MAG TPA: uroporphyrinogen decarboxylase family protein [Clostridiales bacterium]|nr:MAG: methylcobalamin:coenzyme M methyltransferase [Firmicutes bacterium ADurb.Bin262]HOU09339.1 uroporphyrinogen decarboxylase family protein [Clostridiales bacterium]HQH64338.1 uroporphyrinogen decarboxylase family protein [Clostridiales bacterium]HQK74303.1 uroporphyrinogen decarboxylase family protein [Clostridiales bacterium]